MSIHHGEMRRFPRSLLYISLTRNAHGHERARVMLSAYFVCVKEEKGKIRRMIFNVVLSYI